ncbi:GNAT family N-acetyltransferase [Streptomyces sp. 1331.2]|uniref:GNAT family N-acetyltransferase n=1 Tax=Streptomyces sp. 1331.2 TaxID=1938835 RepID=UPI000BD4D230|nr:GNAT family N-acetyltransferase [Streptomyces sp. 1331.2]SOB84897.1 Protein N-acetyltransferase, RimJ/RimL family [Streptomyces sp. 1331.2]
MADRMTAGGLLLRPFEEADAPALIEIYRDETLRRFTRVPVEDAEQAARWLGLQREGWAAGTRYSFAVLDAGELVGNVALKRGVLHRGAPGGSPGGETAEVGYWTAGPARGRGVAPRAVQALTTWAFATFAEDVLHRIDLLHQVDNPASCRVAEKSGYAFQEVLTALPPEFPLDGHRHSRPRHSRPRYSGPRYSGKGLDESERPRSE